ncbi:MAG: pyridoxal phosphate-dependent aminotransferase [Candidatus Bathyarchaeia archaeon]
MKDKVRAKIKASATLATAELAQRLREQGERIIRFDLGEPDFDTPPQVKEAAYEALKRGYTHYSSSRGIPELREAIAANLRDRKVEADPESEIIVTPGAKFAILASMKSTIAPGDEVILLSPYWPTFQNCVELIEGKPVPLDLDGQYHIKEESLKNAVGRKTRMIVVNSPLNPTGTIFDKDDLRIVRDLAIDHDLIVLSDEIYKSFVYDGVKHTSVKALPDMYDRTILVDGLSKDYAMTGWRLGYAVADREIIEAMIRISQNTVTCAAPFVQYAGVVALKNAGSYVDRFRRKFDGRRKLVISLLGQIDQIRYVRPVATFYVFPDVSAYGLSSLEFSKRLLKKTGVSVVPGIAFGQAGEGHVRLSYSTSRHEIIQGFDKIRGFLMGL